MRWKAFFFEKKFKECDDSDSSDYKDEETEKCTYGFKSPRTPPQNIHMNAFESDMYEMIHKVEFNYRPNDFQRQLRSDIRDIRSSNQLLIAADKSNNLYELSTAQYNKLLHDNVTKSYKKCDTNTKSNIDIEAKKIAENLKLDDRIESMASKPAFVTLKDHKPNFQNSPTCRLINPAKSEIGHVSKTILESIVSKVSAATGYNQWRNTASVIDWFKKIPCKRQHRFIKFDICDFYPSITESLLDKALDFAKSMVDISDTEIDIIKHARKSLLFSEGDTWMKKDGDGLFDVTMGSFDGAEVCELVGLYLLSKLTPLLGNESVGLYRDDGLAAVRCRSGRRLDTLRKNISAILKEEGLSITCEANLIVTDYLDATFNLESGKHSPFRKENNKPLYINKKSNHPETIIKELPKMINRRVSDLSHDENEFNKAKPVYEAALEQSGFASKMCYEKPPAEKKRTRNRKSIWFNPPYSSSVKTNIGKLFLNMIKKHFPPTHRYAKIFNRHTLRLSYSCMPNVDAIIKQHNNFLLKPASVTENNATCNCRVANDCPLDGMCLTPAITYSATVTTKPSNVESIYYGLCEPPFKDRYGGHVYTFKHIEKRASSELSKFIWKLKEKAVDHSIKWAIALRSHNYRNGSRRCDLCLTEKMLIARSKHPKILNERSELISKCRHRNKFLLRNLRD